MSQSENITELLVSLASQDYGYLTTKGRVSGRPHAVEIWFGVSGEKIYLLSGGGLGSDWVKNLIADPAISLRIEKKHFIGEASLVQEHEEDAMVRRLLASKYYHWREGRPLNDWARTAQPVAIKLTAITS